MEYTIVNDNVRSFLDQMEDEPVSTFDIACELLLGCTAKELNTPAQQ